MKPPYFAVIFTSTLSSNSEGYDAMSEKMASLAAVQPGFLGFDSARSAEGAGITVSYWESLESIRAWKNEMKHAQAQAQGRSKWYARYRIRISQVQEDYSFEQ